MKTVQDHAGFAEATRRQELIREKIDALTTEQGEILAKLRFKEPTPIPSTSLADRALALAQDENPIPSRAEAVDLLRARELEIRGQLEVLGQGLRQAPELVERERAKAQAEAMASRAKQLAHIKTLWASAQAALVEAMAAEDAITTDLLDAGFGRVVPTITAPAWINRELALAELT